MARQPFHPQYSGSSASIGSADIEKLPHLAQLVGRITVNWSGVDLQMSLLLGSLLGVENEAAVAVFLSLKQHRTQRDALIAAADKCLSPELRVGFDALISIHQRLDKQRNDLVHGVFGICEKAPNGVVWSSSQNHANMLIRDYHHYSGDNPSTEFDRAYEITKNCFVIYYADLEELNKSIISFEQAIGHFHSHLRYHDQLVGTNALVSFHENPEVMSELRR